MDTRQGLIGDQELEAAMATLPGDRVTKDAMDARIVDVAYVRMGETVTLCTITLDNGYSVRGESACVDPANYRADIGQRLAHDKAYDKLWPLIGFLLAEGRHQRRRREDEARFAGG